MKKWMLISVILVQSFFVFAQVDTAIVKGKVQSGHVKKVQIEWILDNSITGIQKAYSADVDKNGQFVLKVPLVRIGNGRISAGNYSHDISLLPKDNFFATIDGDTIQYNGNGADKNNFLYYIETKGYSNASYYKEINELKLKPNEFAVKMAQFRDKRIELITAYSKKLKLQKDFVDYFLAENSVIYINMLNSYVKMYTYVNKIAEDSLNLLPEFFKYNQFKNIVDDKNVNSFNYLNGLRSLVFSKGFELFKKEGIKEKRLSMFHRIILDSLTGKTQEFFMANWLCGDLSRNSVDTVIYGKFKEIAKDKLAISTVNEAFVKYNQKNALIGKPLNNEFYQTLVEDTLGNVMEFGKLMEKFKGKVVYLDIWGLGCGPCRASMPYSKKLREKLSNQPIEFVFLTIDNKYDSLWTEIVEVSLTNKNQYRLTDGFRSKFLQFMQINWVPCHMILDKEGNLADYNAPIPQAPALELMLLNLVGKK